MVRSPPGTGTVLNESHQICIPYEGLMVNEFAGDVNFCFKE